MAKTSGEDNLHNIKNNVDKEFNEWRQPVPPKSPKSPPEFGEGHSEPTAQAKSVCGVKDLYRLSRKRRTVLSARNSRLCSRRRNENKESVSNAEAKPRITKKDPLPMRLRSFPQSFFQQPSSMKTSSMAQNTYSRLPPLFPRDHNPDEEATERPITPPEERMQPKPKPPKRVLTSPPNTELLFSLFDPVTPNQLEKKLVKRGRPKKVHSEKTKIPLPNPNHDEDPCMVENLTGKLFPQLSLENCHKSPNATLASISIVNGTNYVELPTLAVENNYPQMLRELAQVL